GRYTLMLADGLPLYGGQAGGLGVLQIPPVDLARAEVIKGMASALYGASALGGVINLVSRRPADTALHEVLVNQTSRGGTDAVAFLSGPLGAAGRSSLWGATLLAGAHRQAERDVSGDGWADLAGYERAVVRPRLFYGSGGGGSAFVTAGFTAEDREGGTLAGRVAPDGAPYVEGLRTRRADGGLVGRLVAAGRDIYTVRAAGVEQHHRHRFGLLVEDDVHRTWFAEASAAMPRGRWTWVAGAAYQEERYRNEDVAGFDYTFRVPSAFAQADVDPAPWLALSMSARADRHSVYGTVVSPRVSALLRAPDDGALAGWTARLSAGGGAFAPSWLTEETEAVGLDPVVRPGALGAPARLRLERATGGSVDVGGRFGALEVNVTGFTSEVRRPLQAREVPPVSSGDRSLLLVENATRPTRTVGADAFVRLRVDDVMQGEVGVIASVVAIRATEQDPETGARRRVPLTPRRTAALDLIWEREGKGRGGLEFFYTGPQPLDDTPYRMESRPYLAVGVLAEWRVGRARLFVNGENLLDVRQTKVDPLLLPARGKGGRWTTDVWSFLEGRTINGGVRAAF
ncbi:MAG TPA: TonB-dependent receptor, partial [Gemmatimonadaceae bacterium]|nr:TonB-dependent receptor [Gemmatimonadaceae bacterium]